MTELRAITHSDSLIFPGDPSAMPSPETLDYQTFANFLREIVWITDSKGRAVFYNQYWYDFTGCIPGPEMRREAWSVLHPDDRIESRLKWEEALLSNANSLTHEFRIRHKDGDYRWFSVHGFAQRSDTGELIRWIGTATDINAVKQTLVSLHNSEKRYRALVDASSQIVWTNTPDGKMLGEQPGWCAFTGQTEEEYNGYGWTSAVHPDDAGPTIAAWNESIRTNSPFLFEHRVRRWDGVWRLFAIRAVPVLDEANHVREWVGIHSDITEKREAEQLQARTLIQLSAVLASASDGIVVADTAGKILMMNPVALELHGFSSPLNIDARIEDYTQKYALIQDTGEELPIHDWPIARALRGEKFKDQEYRVVRKETGTDSWIAYSGGPASGSDNNLSLIVLTLRDISGRKQIETQRDNLLHRVEEAAERQRRFLREMLSSMSEGRLRLCETATELPAFLTPTPIDDPVSLTRATIRNLRRQTIAACAEIDLSTERESDLITSVGEAAMNAVVHAGGGIGTVYRDLDRGIVQVWIVDNGTGIQEESLHRATLEKGYTTAGTLGHGFWMILKTADRVYLLTGTGGTTIVIEQEKEPPVPAWMQSFVDANTV